jgi:hypothetical protein
MHELKILKQIGLAILLCSMCGMVSPAWAQGTPQERSACMGDAFKFCLSDIPNVSAIEGCLKRNEPELSPACREEFRPDGRSRLREEYFR